ncbi:hypothetical protein QQS21_011303 [Conoideocrella luteorostrata]|uniref:Caspase domain-containing protein n=1 Tax=Conoideocrella luteorostrata TaxID=1105319 RepID=A0AAJ0CDN5_9HYPO|nr:hypothetical protein QQS21_011303 [Conoideocrella luteorostrata]
MSTRPKRPRSPSPGGDEPSIRPKRAFEPPTPIDSLQDFASDLKKTVQKVLPTGGRRYDQAAVLAITFSESDIEGIYPLRDELLKVFQNQYNWVIETHVIDVNLPHQLALLRLNNVVANFLTSYASQSQDSTSLSCIYYSGHGFMNKRRGLTICSKFNGSEPSQPYLHWDQLKDLGHMFSSFPTDHRLLLLDCCAAGLGGLDQNIELLGASSWESNAPANPQASFTRALIDELNSAHGAPISITQLVAKFHTRKSVQLGRSTPVYRPAGKDTTPALIHRIEKTPQPSSPQVAPAPAHAHVLISVTVKKENSVPKLTQWAEWLKSNLPPYIGEIDIVAKWKTGSATVIFVLPIEIWLALPDNGAYSFVSYHYMWDSADARRRHAAALEPQEMRHASVQEQGPLPRMRHGNIPPPGRPHDK